MEMLSPCQTGVNHLVAETGTPMTNHRDAPRAAGSRIGIEADTRSRRLHVEVKDPHTTIQSLPAEIGALPTTIPSHHVEARDLHTRNHHRHADVTMIDEGTTIDVGDMLPHLQRRTLSRSPNHDHEDASIPAGIRTAMAQTDLGEGRHGTTTTEATAQMVATNLIDTGRMTDEGSLEIRTAIGMMLMTTTIASAVVAAAAAVAEASLDAKAPMWAR